MGGFSGRDSTLIRGRSGRIGGGRILPLAASENAVAETGDVITENSAPAARYHRLRVGLWSVLIVVIAVSLGWLGQEGKRARDQRIAVEALRQAGCSVEYDDGNARTVPKRL